MKTFYVALTAIVAFAGTGLYAQEAPKIKLEKVWEKDISASELVFLDDNGYNVFSSMCKDPEKALKNMKAIAVQTGTMKWLEGPQLAEVKAATFDKVKDGNKTKSIIAVSKNGRNIAVLEGLVKGNYEEKEFGYKYKPCCLRLLDWQGSEMAKAEVMPFGEYIYLWSMGNDKTIVVFWIAGEGHDYGVKIYTKKGSTLKETYSIEGLYPTGVFDYAENGTLVFIIHNGKRIILDDEGKVLSSFDYIQPGWWAGWVSPRGNYHMEVTRGKYVVIRSKRGDIIKEHHVQGPGNYYAAFSPDEKYLAVTPGPWRAYLFETGTGTMLWEYKDNSDETNFGSVTVTNDGLVCLGRSEAIIEPAKYRGTIDELNKQVEENDTKNRSVYIVNKGILVDTLGPFPGQGFGSQLQSPDIRTNINGGLLYVKTPTNVSVYRIGGVK